MARRFLHFSHPCNAPVQQSLYQLTTHRREKKKKTKPGDNKRLQGTKRRHGFWSGERQGFPQGYGKTKTGLAFCFAFLEIYRAVFGASAASSIAEEQAVMLFFEPFPRATIFSLVLAKPSRGTLEYRGAGSTMYRESHRNDDQKKKCNKWNTLPCLEAPHLVRAH